jgi:hypothetical protein
MTSKWINAALGKAGILACSLLLAGGAALAQSTITLVAGPTSTTLPDGQSVPMWGYTCGDALATPVPSTNATCAAANGNPQTGASWQPPVITVPKGNSLTITLVNNLSFTTAGTPNAVPTSLVIVGQLGGGLGDTLQRGKMPSPIAHADQGTTWPGTVGGTNPANGDAIFTPPTQEARLRSFAAEVAAGANASLCWGAGCPGSNLKADLRPGTYLIESGTQPSIQGAMGLYGVLVVTELPTTTGGPSVAYGTTFDKDVALLLSEIDPVQNFAIDTAVHTAGFSDANVWSGQPGQCGDLPPSATSVATTANTCYPPAVNYSPLYYLVNGMAFDRTSVATAPSAVVNAVPVDAAQGRVLLRLVNAGLRMHVPNVVGAPMTLLAEDGNQLPGLARVQNSVFMAAGKTYDVVIKPQQVVPATNPATYTNATYAVFDRQLSLSTANQRDGGMQAYIKVGVGAPVDAKGNNLAKTKLSSFDKTYYCSAGVPLVISDKAKGLLGGTVGANGVALGTTLTGDVSTSTLTLQANGTFAYTPSVATSCGGSFTFLVNGTTTQTATIAECDASSSAATGCTVATAPTASAVVFTSNVASRYVSSPPGVLGSNVTNPSGLAMTAVSAATGVSVNADGSFVAAGPGTAGACALAVPAVTTAGASCVNFNYQAKNAQGSLSNTAVATVVFLPASNLAVSLKDAKTGVAVTDYRWIIEEDRTFWIDPKCQVNSAVRPAGCPPLPVESLGYNFHTANMPVIAQGCMGTVSCESQQTVGGTAAVCDIGNGICRTDAAQKTPLNPGDVHLDPNKRYFISVLPGDGVNPTIGGAGGAGADGKPFNIATACGPYNGPSGAWEPAGTGALCGHEMGGAQLSPAQTAVTITLQQTPLPTAKISVFVFQDDNPLNGENDAGGGVDVIAPNEAGLGGFEIKLFDQAGQLGDNTGQITYDMFNQPVSNALAGYIDPLTTLNACPITARKDGIVGMVPTCPKFESDGSTLSPLAGQAVIANLYPGLYEIQAYPAADRIGRGEQWLQTNTLDGGKPHEAFIKPNEPGYFQEFGPGGFHVAIGFANPAIINARKAGYCASTLNPGGACNNTLTVEVTNNHMSRTPDQRTYDTESYDHYSFTQCYVSIGPADAEDFDIEPCVFTTDPTTGKTHATATFTGMPAGTFKMSVFDQWNDIMLDGLVGTVEINGSNTKKIFPVTQWRTNLYTRTFIDDPHKPNPGVSDDSKLGLALVNTNIRYRDGSVAFFNNTDLNGYAGFNEVFPFMNWLVVETTQTRFKPTWVHSVYDAGGPVDGSSQDTAASRVAGSTSSNIAANLANTDVRVKLPTELRVPGAKYCDSADCPDSDGFTGKSSGTLFPGQGFFSNTMGWQGLLGQNTFMEFGVKPFKASENGGIHGNVIYASTRPFDDPSLSLQLSWEPGVPRVKINLYKKDVDASGNEKLTLVDSTLSTSFDDWAQGFRRDANGTLMQRADGTYIPNMNCPGQDAGSPFFATLKDSKEYLDPDRKSLAYHAQFKCYDGWSQLNQAQPAPYDGFYKFPSVTAVDPLSGKPTKTNCASCGVNPDDGTPMLPSGKYVVEVVVPSGYELVKEEDKNILLGDVYIAPVTQQFAGFGNVFIMPDQAAVNSHYNSNNPGGLNKTNNLGSVTFPRHEGDTGSIEAYWPCVGAERIVPDLNSLFPQAGQAAPFAGAKRRLCDRKEVALDDQSSVLAKFYVFSSTHIAGHFTGTITNDFASEFDPFSPQFGEKFGPPNLPVGIRDFNGNEVARVYSDQWGIYNGLYFSSWSVNPPNPTGYAPQMSIACMNDPGPINIGTAAAPNWVTDPSYNPAYSNFCYEQPFMPGTTTYMDTPVIPTQAFADGYNLPDTEYPDQTPAIKAVTSTAVAGPWVHAAVTATPAAAASGTLTFSNVSINDRVSSVSAGSATLTGGSITCLAAAPSSCPAGNANQTTRNNRMATLVANSINSGTATTGYSATVGGGNNANRVTITATTASASPNGTVLTVVQTGVAVGGSQILAGGADALAAQTAAMDLTITALGDKVVQNPNFAGPNAPAAPYNQKTITRHYGFGSSTSQSPGTAVLVAPDGTTTVSLTNIGWSDTVISATVPTLSNAFNCKIQQKNAPTAQCGQLVITRGDNGKRSIDAITVTVGGSSPWVVTPTGVTAPAGKTAKDYAASFGRMNLSANGGIASPIQVALDSAAPGDLILVQPGTYRENLIMWKPVRLQGVGAASVTVNADAHPAGHMDQWRNQMVCVFGLTLQGVPNMGNSQAAFDPSGQFSCPAEMFLTSDRIPFEAITGWQASGNGNLAQVLQEPTLLGAYEGAGITTVGRGVHAPAGDPFFLGNDPAAAGGFPDGSRYLTNSATDCTVSTGTTAANGGNYGTSNYLCNPSRIDGLSILNSSQGGGGMFIHGWAHNLEVANNRISSNHGTLAGAINLGNGETPPVFLNDGVTCGAGVTALCPPIPNGTPNGGAIPFAFNTFVRIHHNMLYNNASIGDALFTGTPAGAGGVTVSAGGDNFQIDHNWIAGNLTTGDGGGLQTLGVTFNGKINNNVILFNQSTNPTLPTNGGGIVIQGANEPRTLNGSECGGATDTDCPPGLGDGTGAGLVIDSNLIYGNSAESGTGGGIALEQVNGSEVIAFPTRPANWYGITLSNNIIANNVAGYDGGGVSMRDALKVSLVNNTIVSNDTTASAGVLFKTLGAINSSNPPPGCNAQTNPTLPQDPSCTGNAAPHGPQPSGLVTMAHTQNLNEAIATIVPTGSGPQLVCPSGYGYANGAGSGNGGLNNADCKKFSRPALVNDLFWQNRTFSVNIVGPGSGNISQQNLVAITPQLNQTATGQCASGAQFWDIGLRTDDVTVGLITAAANKLAITNSILTGTGDIGTAQETVASGTNRVGVANPVIAQVCNGARVPPEYCGSGADVTGGQNGGASCKGYNAPAGASESTSTSQLFVFNGIQPTATVDEGHNWLNLVYGPLTLNRSAVQSGSTNAPELMLASAATGTAGGAYSIPVTSAAVNGGSNTVAPATDFFGNPRARSDANPADIGAVECQGTACTGPVPAPIASVTPTTLTFASQVTGTTSASQFVTLSNTGNATLTGVTLSGLTAEFQRVTGAQNCPAAPFNLAQASTCRIYVTFTPSATGARTASLGITAGNATVTGSPVTLSGTGAAPTHIATVSPSPLAFGNWAGGTTSSALSVTVTNTGNSQLTGLTYTFGGGAPQPFSRANGGAGGTCGVTLNANATCTVNVVFAAPATGATPTPYSRTLTVAATGATITPTPITLTGTSVASRSAVLVSAPTITLPSGAGNLTGTGLVTFTNNGSAGGAQVNVSNVTVSGGSLLTYFFNVGALAGPDNCTGVPLAPGASCTVTVRFTNGLSPRGANRTGTVTFTDTGVPVAPSTTGQSAVLTGFATP